MLRFYQFKSLRESSKVVIKKCVTVEKSFTGTCTEYCYSEAISASQNTDALLVGNGCGNKL